MIERPVDLAHADDRGPVLRHLAHLARVLAQVQLGDEHELHPPGHRLDDLHRQREQGVEVEHLHLQPFLLGQLPGRPGAARARPVGHDAHAALALVLDVVEAELVAVVAHLVVELAQELLALLRVVGGEPGLVVDEPGHVRVRLRAQHVGRMHLAHHIGMDVAGGEVEIAAGEPVAADELGGEALAHVADHLVGEQRDRRAEALCEADRRHGQPVHVGHVGGGQHHRRVVAVGAPAGLHDVALRRARSDARWTGPARMTSTITSGASTMMA